MAMIHINDRVSIDESELSFTASRSSGPGGQHVNVTDSRVTLGFDVAGSPSLDEADRQRLLERLASRINREGVLRMHCQKHRSQGANREEVVGRFVVLLRDALVLRKRRRRTRPGRAAIERRLAEKRRRARIKRDRSGGGEE